MIADLDVLAAVASDDHPPDEGAVDLDGAPDRRRDRVPWRKQGQRGLAVGRMPHDDGARSCRHAARPRVGDAVDDREAVPAVARQTERPAAGRRLARSHDRDGDRVADPERHRSTVDHDPTFDRRLGRAVRDLGHARIRRPWGSNSGSGWSRAGRRRPTISISNAEPPGPSGDESAVGT